MINKNALPDGRAFDLCGDAAKVYFQHLTALYIIIAYLTGTRKEILYSHYLVSLQHLFIDNFL